MKSKLPSFNLTSGDLSDKTAADFGVKFIDGSLEGLLSRSVIVTDSNGVVKYTQQVAETTDEPDYEPALAAL